MKHLVAAFTTLLLTSTAFAGDVTFSPKSVYTPKQKMLLTQSIHKSCPGLVDGDHRASFVEVGTRIFKRRVDQNMFDTVYTTEFYFETHESGRFNGTVIFMGEINYNEKKIAGFTLVGDSEKVCNRIR